MSRVKVEFHGDKSNLDSVIHSIHGSMEGLKEMVAGAFTVEALKEFTSKTLELGTTLTNEALRLNMTVEQVQILKQAAKDSGVEFEKLESILDKVSIAKAKALGGDKDALKNFAALGVSKDQLNTSKSVDLLFNQIAESVKSKGGEAIAEPLGEILGRGFGDVIPLLKTNVEDVSEELKSFGGVMSTETAVKLKVLNDQFEMIGNMLVSLFAPAIVSTIDDIEGGIGKILHNTFDSKEDRDKNKNNNGEADLNPAHMWKQAKGLGSGIGNGLLGMGELLLSGGGLSDNKLHDASIDRIMKSDNAFNSIGMGGGIMDKLADQMIKGKNPADAWDDIMKRQHDKADSLTKQIHGDSQKDNKTIATVDDKKKKGGFKEYHDAFTESGNMLGASFTGVGNVVNDVAKNQLNEAKKQTSISTQNAAYLKDISDGIKLLKSTGWS